MLVNAQNHKKIVVGVSGGVDSSVVAYLLKQQGYDVHGVFVKTWSPEWLPCTWIDEKRDAMRVCAALDIPFHFLDAEQAYKDGVADYMIAQYRKGVTPNPDVLCNRVIKFGVLWEYAQSIGAEMLATGHYAQVVDGQLKKGIDESKDQSYFLWMLTKEELPRVTFPIGHLRKSEVRALAEKAGLMTATKKDSQGICFLGDVDMREFLSHYIDQKKGPVVNQKGDSIGEHDGVWFYTLGERHGFRITEERTHRPAYYVVNKNIETNTLVVSPVAQVVSQNNGIQRISLRDVNWIEALSIEGVYTGQIRYHGAQLPVHIIDTTTIEITYDGVVALGQSIVFYEGDVLIGGGVVDAVIPAV